MLPGTKLLLPTGMLSQWWVLDDMMEKRGFVFKQSSNTAIASVVPVEHRGYFYAPGTTTAIMAGGTWRPLHQTSSMVAFAPGDSHYIASEDDARTYLATLGTDGKLTAKVFAERGGHSAIADAAGNVYIADGQVYV